MAGDYSVEWVLAPMKGKNPVVWNMTKPMDYQYSGSIAFLLSNLRIEMKRKNDTGLPRDIAVLDTENIWSIFQHTEGMRIYGREILEGMKVWFGRPVFVTSALAGLTAFS